MAYIGEHHVEFSDDKKTLVRCPEDIQGEYIVPNSVTNIEKFAFADCKGLTSITIPNSVISIGGQAFRGCTSLTSIAIPNSVKSIGLWAFRGCKSLNAIIVPPDLEEQVCEMVGLKDYANIIRETSERIRKREEGEQRRIEEQQNLAMLPGCMLFFKTETSGFPKNYGAPISDLSNWPHLIQLAWIMVDKNGNVLKKRSIIIKPIGFSISSEVEAIHGITTKIAVSEGKPLAEVLEEFSSDLTFASRVVGHNLDYDLHIVGVELYRHNKNYEELMTKPSVCTMKSTIEFCAIPNPNYGGYKWPSLSELYRKLFGRSLEGSHDALADIIATKECYFELKRREIILE